MCVFCLVLSFRGAFRSARLPLALDAYFQIVCPWVKRSTQSHHDVVVINCIRSLALLRLARNAFFPSLSHFHFFIIALHSIVRPKWRTERNIEFCSRTWVSFFDRRPSELNAQQFIHCRIVWTIKWINRIIYGQSHWRRSMRFGKEIFFFKEHRICCLIVVKWIDFALASTQCTIDPRR